MASDPSEIGTTGAPVTPGPGTVYPSAGTVIYTSAMISAINQEHNLQAMVELQYVRVGSEVMNSALSSLDQALQVTQDSLNQLSNLQDLHNQIAVTGSSTFPFNFTAQSQTLTVNTSATISTLNTVITQTGGGTTIVFGTTTTATTNSFITTTTFVVNDFNSYIKGYQLLASSFYGTPVSPFLHISMGGFNSNIVSGNEPAYTFFKNSLLSARAGLSGLISRLSSITKPGDSTTLLAKLKAVYASIPSAGAASFSAIKGWALDNYAGVSGGSISKSGHFQQEITDAITAAESLNTTQTDSVRNYMFVFEQYCQSASAVLTALQQLFDKISRGIAGA